MIDLCEVTSVSGVIGLKDELQKFHRHTVADRSLETRYRFPFGLWFRGQGNADRRLVPGVFRPLPGEDPAGSVYSYDETSMFHHFQVRAADQRSVYRGIFDWLCLMQHYELPTRLLDWSESALVALYFAVNEPQDWGTDGRLYVLNAKRLNRRTGWTLTEGTDRGVCSPWSPNAVMRAQQAVARCLGDWRQRMRSVSDADSTRASVCHLISRNKLPALQEALALPVAVLPSRLNGRMIFQSSCFTLHGGKLYPSGPAGKDELPLPVSLEDLNQEESLPERQFLRCFRVPKNAKKPILEELLLLGIHPGSLFPEVDRQAQHIRALWQKETTGASATPCPTALP